MVSDIEFGNDLTERTTVKDEKGRTQYRALRDTERKTYSHRETITYFNILLAVQ